MTYAVFSSEALPEDIDAALDQGADAHQPVVAIFPDVRDVDALVRLLRRLDRAERWSCTRIHVKGVPMVADLVRVLWQTPLAEWRSEVMGLGPLPSMPVTRRAPFFCFVLWPGGPSDDRLFPRGSGKERIVDLLDTDREFREAERLKAQSQTGTGEITANPHDDVRFYRDVAFALPAGAWPRWWRFWR
jgi:hypothetical protein